MKPMRVYLAARYSRRAEMLRYAADLAQLGLGTVECEWLSGTHEWDGSQAPGEELARAQQFALDDLRDLARAQVVIVFTEQPIMEVAREALASSLVEELRAGADPEDVIARVLAIGRNRGGRHVEYGLALANLMAKPPRQYVLIVGPAENVFHTLPMVPRVAGWVEAVAHLTAAAAEADRQAIRRKLTS